MNRNTDSLEIMLKSLRKRCQSYYLRVFAVDVIMVLCNDLFYGKKTEN